MVSGAGLDKTGWEFQSTENEVASGVSEPRVVTMSQSSISENCSIAFLRRPQVNNIMEFVFLFKWNWTYSWTPRARMWPMGLRCGTWTKPLLVKLKIFWKKLSFGLRERKYAWRLAVCTRFIVFKILLSCFDTFGKGWTRCLPAWPYVRDKRPLFVTVGQSQYPKQGTCQAWPNPRRYKPTTGQLRSRSRAARISLFCSKALI